MASSAMVTGFIDFVFYAVRHLFFMGLLIFVLFFFLSLDLYAFIIGSYVIWTAVAGVRYSIEHIRTKKVVVLLNQIWKWCGIVVKSSALLSIWVRITYFLLLVCYLIFHMSGY